MNMATVVSQRDAELIDKKLRLFTELQGKRAAAFEGHWEEIASLIDPNKRGTFTSGGVALTAGEKRTQQQVDATGMVALRRFAAICDSLLTPRNMRWHGLAANNAYVMKDRATREWFQKATDALFKFRYAPEANFAMQNQSIFRGLGAYGTSAMFVDQLDDIRGRRGLRYKSMALGELFIHENHQGVVDGFIRRLRYTARQALQKWGEEKFPDLLKGPLEKGSEQLFTFIHVVCPRDDYDPDRLDARGKPFLSCYISVEARCLMQEGGYYSFPMAVSRYDQEPDEVYGRSPAMDALPSLKTLNAEKTVFLKQGHRAADPVLLSKDDGLMNMNLRPGAINPGGWSSDGKPLVGVLPTGDIQISKEMMAEEKALINDVFLVTLFQILTETPTMTATEVIERTNEKGILLAPTVGGQQSGYLGPLIERELDLLGVMGVLEPMPPRLREAQGEYQVIYTSPLSRAMKAQESAGFMRTLESVKDLVQITGDPGLLDPFNFDVAIPEIAEQQAVPVTWMATDDQIAGKRENRAKMQQQQAAIQAMPAQAAMMKAQAVAAEKGGAPQ